jgi:hypothetical protein
MGSVMSQQQRLIYLPLIGAIILCILVGVYLAASKRSKSNSPSKIKKHRVKTSPDDSLKYWTADKMRNAKPAPLPEVNTLDREKQDPHPSRPQDA